MINIDKLTIREAGELLRKGELTSVQIAKHYLKNIEEKNKQLNVYLEVFDDVLDQAKKADEKIKFGKAGLLCGIPFAIKDNILIKDRKVSASSKILEGYIAPYDAFVIEKLKDEGVVFLGRVNMDEFAMGGSTENSAYGVTRNPYDTDRVAGGSSGGSASAVSANMAMVALGSDTGGSIRQPASFCGLVGLKPTYGAVSRSGLMAMSSSLDQIGPITKNVDDAEIIFNVISGKDKKDSTSVDISVLSEKIKINDKLKIGVPYEFLKGDGIDNDVSKNIEESISKFKKLGYEIIPIELPMIKYSLAVYYIICPAEVSSNMARYDGMKYGKRKDGENLLGDYFATRGDLLGQEVKRRIILGTYVLSSGYYDAYYGKANIVRDMIKKDFDKAFTKVDLILTPTTPSPAFKIGEKIDNPLEMYLADIFTVPINLAGIPAMSICSGFKEIDGKKLPLGIQLIAQNGGEGVLFKAGKDFYSEK